jgi:hypothetical protein
MQIRFCITTDGLSTRDKELEDSERRAHMARAGHRRKDGKQRPERKKSSPPQVIQVLDVPEPKNNIAGSSDPFGTCKGVKITAHVNHILTFMRDVMYPAIYFTPWTKSCSAEPPGKLEIVKPSRVVSAGSAHRDWQRLLWTLQDEGLGMACLAACASFVPQFRKTMKVEIMRMRAQSVSSLRVKLEERSPDAAISGRDLLQMFWLFEAEALDGNVDAALVHGKAFRAAVENCQDKETIDLGNIVMFLWADTNFAAKTMRHTMLSMQWCMQQLEGIWQRLSPLFPAPVSGIDLKLSPSVEAPPLVSLVAL